MPRRGSCDDVSDSEHQDFKPHPRICQIGWNFQCCHSSVNELKLPVTLARSYGQDRFPEQPSHAARVRARCAASAGHAVPCTSLARAHWHFTYNPCRTLQVSSESCNNRSIRRRKPSTTTTLPRGWRTRGSGIQCEIPYHLTTCFQFLTSVYQLLVVTST